MADAKRKSHSFDSSKEVRELKNTKFFLGDDRNTTHEQLLDAASQAFTHVRMNSPVKIESIDSHLKSNKLSDNL